MAVNKTPNYSLNKPDKGTRGWDVYLNQNADIIDSELKRLKDKDASQDLRIDNIVAQAGTDNTEIVDARLGADGVSRSTLGTLVREMHSQLIKTNQQSTTIGHGLNFINASQSSPLDVRIEGRTLVNLLGRAGNCEDASKWSDYQTTHTTDSSNFVYGTSGMKVTIQSGFSTGATFYTIPGGLKANKYYILIGEVKNGNASNGAWINFGGIEGVGLGSSALIADTSKFNIVWVKTNPTIDKVNVNVDLSVSGNEGQYCYFDCIRLYEITAEEYANIGTVWDDEEIARRYPYVDSVQHVQNPYVIAESENLLPPFTEWTLHGNPSTLFAEVKLGALGDKKDILWKDGQDWKVTKWVEKDIPLDGKLTWYLGSDYSGYKRVYADATQYEPVLNSKKEIVVKYNGKILKTIDCGGIEQSSGDEAFISGDGQRNVYISIFDADSGWGETYAPTQAEIQAFFWGWRMCNGTYGQPYDGTGTKTWYPIGDSDLSRAVTTCPTSAAPTIAEGKIGYYKISYILATPQTIVVTDKVEGDLVVNGQTQVEVGSGFTYTEVDGERTYTKLAENQRYNVTSNILSIIANYNSSLKSVVDSVVAKQSDIAAQVSVNVRAIAELYKRVKALGG